MAIKVNDDGQRMMLTDDVLDRIRLTADKEGAPLGWVLLKDIIDLIGMTDLGVIQSNAIDTLVKRGVYKYTRTYMDFGKSVQQDGVIFVQGDKVPISGSGDYTIYQVCFEGCSIKVRSKGSSGLIWSEWNEIGGNINIVQTTGESKTDVMSQSAVTYVLNKKMNAPLTTFSTKDEVEHCVDIGNYSVFLYENPYPILGDSFTLLVLNLNADGDSYMQVGISYTGDGYVMAARSGSEGSWSEWEEIGGGTSVEVAQTTGQSTTSVMSQKAVTAELTKKITNPTGGQSGQVLYYGQWGNIPVYEPSDFNNFINTGYVVLNSGMPVSSFAIDLSDVVTTDDPSIFIKDGSEHVLKFSKTINISDIDSLYEALITEKRNVSIKKEISFAGVLVDGDDDGNRRYLICDTRHFVKDEAGDFNNYIKCDFNVTQDREAGILVLGVDITYMLGSNDDMNYYIPSEDLGQVILYIF